MKQPRAGRCYSPAMRSDPIVMDGPVLVYGGTYGNLLATLALLKEAERLGVPRERMVCTGDVAAYCAEPLATAGVVRRFGGHVVMGNCEESLGNDAADCGCGFADGSACAELAAEWYAHAARALDAEHRAWMRGLPRRLDILVGGRRLAVIHGSVSRINRFIFASTAQAEKLREIELAGTDGVIGGHCGLPFTQNLDGRLWHNPGAVGLPANDGTPRVWYSLLTPEADGLRIEHRALEYEYRGAARSMRAINLAGGYADALEMGLWPSCDVLPPAEIGARGKPLVPGSVPWPDRRNGPAAWP